MDWEVIYRPTKGEWRNEERLLIALESMSKESMDRRWITDEEEEAAPDDQVG